jgi:hypothetical protein
MQGLLDPSDASLDFVMKRDNVRPIAIYRIEEDFLLCYDGKSDKVVLESLADLQNSLSTSIKMVGGRDLNGLSFGKVYLLLSVRSFLPMVEIMLISSFAISIRHRVRANFHRSSPCRDRGSSSNHSFSPHPMLVCRYPSIASQCTHTSKQATHVR